MIYKILQMPDPKLREVSAPIPDGVPDKEFLTLGGNMRDTLKHHGGLGISAVQIGKLLRIVVVNQRCGIPYAALFNPELTWLSSDREVLSEGCLSIEHGKVFWLIPRSKQCAITFTTSTGERKGFRCAGLTSRLMQHEIDHLNGVLCIDRFNARLPAAQVGLNGSDQSQEANDTCGNA